MRPDELSSLPRPLAFVMPGGGALGGYQVGVLKALTEAGVTPDLLVGVSAGAVNAAMFAWNPGVDGVAHIESVWRSIRRRDLMRFHPARMVLALVGRFPSFLDNQHGRRWLERHLGDRLIEQAPTRLVLVGTDLRTGEAVGLHRGDVVSAVLASSAFPGVYPPVEIDGQTLVDGGVVADIPLDLVASLGVQSALVLQLPPLAHDAAPHRAIDILFRASTLGVEAHGRTVMRRPPHGLGVVEIPAPPSPVTTFSVDRAATVIDAGYRAAREWLTG